MTHKSNNLSHAHDAEVQALYEDICETAKQVMDPFSFMLFTLTPWEETGGKSVMDLADEGNVEGLTVIRDGLAADVAEFLAEGDAASDEGTIQVTADPVTA